MGIADIEARRTDALIDRLQREDPEGLTHRVDEEDGRRRVFHLLKGGNPENDGDWTDITPFHSVNPDAEATPEAVSRLTRLQDRLSAARIQTLEELGHPQRSDYPRKPEFTGREEGQDGDVAKRSAYQAELEKWSTDNKAYNNSKIQVARALLLEAKQLCSELDIDTKPWIQEQDVEGMEIDELEAQLTRLVLAVLGANPKQLQVGGYRYFGNASYAGFVRQMTDVEDIDKTTFIKRLCSDPDCVLLQLTLTTVPPAQTRQFIHEFTGDMEAAKGTRRETRKQPSSSRDAVLEHLNKPAVIQYLQAIGVDTDRIQQVYQERIKPASLEDQVVQELRKQPDLLRRLELGAVGIEEAAKELVRRTTLDGEVVTRDRLPDFDYFKRKLIEETTKIDRLRGVPMTDMPRYTSSFDDPDSQEPLKHPKYHDTRVTDFEKLRENIENVLPNAANRVMTVNNQWHERQVARDAAALEVIALHKAGKRGVHILQELGKGDGEIQQQAVAYVADCFNSTGSYPTVGPAYSHSSTQVSEQQTIPATSEKIADVIESSEPSTAPVEVVEMPASIAQQVFVKNRADQLLPLVVEEMTLVEFCRERWAIWKKEDNVPFKGLRELKPVVEGIAEDIKQHLPVVAREAPNIASVQSRASNLSKAAEEIWDALEQDDRRTVLNSGNIERALSVHHAMEDMAALTERQQAAFDSLIRGDAIFEEEVTTQEGIQALWGQCTPYQQSLFENTFLTFAAELHAYRFNKIAERAEQMNVQEQRLAVVRSYCEENEINLHLSNGALTPAKLYTALSNESKKLFKKGRKRDEKRLQTAINSVGKEHREIADSNRVEHIEELLKEMDIDESDVTLGGDTDAVLERINGGLSPERNGYVASTEALFANGAAKKAVEEVMRLRGDKRNVTRQAVARLVERSVYEGAITTDAVLESMNGEMAVFTNGEAPAFIERELAERRKTVVKGALQRTASQNGQPTHAFIWDSLDERQKALFGNDPELCHRELEAIAAATA